MSWNITSRINSRSESPYCSTYFAKKKKRSRHDTGVARVSRCITSQAVPWGMRFASRSRLPSVTGIKERRDEPRSPVSDFDEFVRMRRRTWRAVASGNPARGPRRDVTRTTGRVPATLTEHVPAMTKSIVPFLSVLGMRHPPIQARLHAAAPVAL